MLNVFSIGRTFVSFFATLRHVRIFQQFSDAVYGVYANIFRQVQVTIDCDSYWHVYRGCHLDRVAQLASARASCPRGHRFESGHEPSFSRFPRPNPVARKAFNFTMEWAWNFTPLSAENVGRYRDVHKKLTHLFYNFHGTKRCKDEFADTKR